jgi:predicted HD phosphohydrolase
LPPREDPEVPFTRMDESTAADWRNALAENKRHPQRVADEVLRLLRRLADFRDGSAVDQLTHSLQTATRAERAGGDDELVLAALCHDVGRAISSPNHGVLSAAVLAPYVRPRVAWVVRVHTDFTSRHFAEHLGGFRHHRLRHLFHPGFRLARRFADEWDQRSFDPGYDTYPLDHFEPRLRRLVARARYPISRRRRARRRAAWVVRSLRVGHSQGRRAVANDPP